MDNCNSEQYVTILRYSVSTKDDFEAVWSGLTQAKLILDSLILTGSAHVLQEESWLGIFPKFHQSTAQAKKKKAKVISLV